MIWAETFLTKLQTTYHGRMKSMSMPGKKIVVSIQMNAKQLTRQTWKVNDILVWWSFSKIGSNVWRLEHFHSSLLPNAINWLIIYHIFRMMICSMPTNLPVKINVHRVRVFCVQRDMIRSNIERRLTEVIMIIFVSFQYGSKDTETAVGVWNRVSWLRFKNNIDYFAFQSSEFFCLLLVKLSKVRHSRSLKSVNSWKKCLILQSNSKLLSICICLDVFK